MPAGVVDRLGRYEILEELGRGAMGTVYRARDPKINRIVAIKTIRSFGVTPTQDQEYRRRFFREAQAAGNLSHPGIVTIFDVGEDESTQTPYIVMEYIAGQTLENWLVSGAAQIPSLDASLGLVEQLAEALDYAHAQNIVHRDIKPANIIVNNDSRAKVMDFGVARLTHHESTMHGQLLGTPAYMSPEQLKGDPMDGRSDLFSLGLILYWLLTGEKAFSGDPTTVIAKILYQDPAPVSNANPALGPEFDRVVSRAIAKDPSARYQRGRELAEELNRLRSAELNQLAAAQRESTPSTSLSWTGSAAQLEKTVILDGPLAAENNGNATAADTGAAASNAAHTRRLANRALMVAAAALALSSLVPLLVPRLRTRLLSSFSQTRSTSRVNLTSSTSRANLTSSTSIPNSTDTPHPTITPRSVPIATPVEKTPAQPEKLQPKLDAQSSPQPLAPVADTVAPGKPSDTPEHAPDGTRKSAQPENFTKPGAPVRHHTLKNAATTNLQILCWYDFDSADLSVWADAHLVYETQLKLAKNRTSGYLSATARVPAGKRVVRVRIRSKSFRGDYDRTKTVAAAFIEGHDKTLEITAYELQNNLRLAWQDHTH